MTPRQYDATGWRETSQATELRTADGRTVQALGKGDAVRAVLVAASKRTAS